MKANFPHDGHLQKANIIFLDHSKVITNLNNTSLIQFFCFGIKSKILEVNRAKSRKGQKSLTSIFNKIIGTGQKLYISE